MTGFFWNVRGFNKNSKHEVVRNWIHNKDLKFGCLLETRVKENKAKQIVSSVFKGGPALIITSLAGKEGYGWCGVRRYS